MADTSTQDFSNALKTAPDLEQPFGVTQIHPVEMMANLLKNKIIQTATLPQRAIENSQYSYDSGTYDPAVPVEATTQLARGGVPFAKPGTAGIFGGRLSPKANPDKLAQMERMLGKGQDPNMVRQLTGWHEGHDMSPRWEIPDERSGWLIGPPPKSPYYSATGPAGVMFNHPRLYEAYPPLRNVNMSLEINPNFKDASGGWSLPQKLLEVSAPTMEQARLAALHEFQHGVQHIEGFSPGTTVDSMADFLKKNPDQLHNLTENFPKPAANDPAFNLYNRIGGEVESRNVENRANYGPQQRHDIHPDQSADIPANQQLHLNPIPRSHPILKALREQMT